jgi:hypothetical protein
MMIHQSSWNVSHISECRDEYPISDIRNSLLTLSMLGPSPHKHTIRRVHGSRRTKPRAVRYEQATENDASSEEVMTTGLSR